MWESFSFLFFSSLQNIISSIHSSKSSLFPIKRDQLHYLQTAEIMLINKKLSVKELFYLELIFIITGTYDSIESYKILSDLVQIQGAACPTSCTAVTA